MAEWPVITDGIHGDVPINFFPAADSEKKVILHGAPGLKSIATLTDCSEVRGLTDWGNYLYAIAKRGSESVLWRISPTGTISELGTFTTSSTGPVWMEKNGTQMLIVDGVGAYVFTPATGIFQTVTLLDYDGNGNKTAAAAAYQDTYGLLIQAQDSIRWYFSGGNDFTAYDSKDTYTKVGQPDPLVSIFSHLREVWLFGKSTTEVWYDAGGNNTSPTDPTFARNTGGLLEEGCGAPKTPASGKGLPLTWLSDTGKIIQAVGYTPKEVKNEMFSRSVQGITGDPRYPGWPIISDCIAFSYTDVGHTFYQLTSPSGDETWVYDATTGAFCKKQSWKAGGGYGRHRANCYARLANKHYCGDYSNGAVYEMSMGYYDDDGEEMQRILYSTEVGTSLQFQTFPDVQVEVDAGVGVPLTQAPKMILEISNDGGNTWLPGMQRDAGLTGQYTYRAIWRRLGGGYRRMYRLTVSDPILWRVLGLHWEMK